MIPALFSYAAARSVAEAVDLLKSDCPTARPLTSITGSRWVIPAGHADTVTDRNLHSGTNSYRDADYGCTSATHCHTTAAAGAADCHATGTARAANRHTTRGISSTADCHTA